MSDALNVLRGLQIITKYDPDSYFAAEHDEIFAGMVGKTRPLMSDDELKVMEENGWRCEEDDEHGSWAKLL